MNFKKNKPFVLNNKALEEKTSAYRKRLTVLLSVFAFIVPFIINGFLSYTYSYYIENNAAFAFLDAFLYYFIIIVSSCARYLCYAILIVSIYLFGTHSASSHLLLYSGGIFFTCIIVTYIVSCLLGGYMPYDFSDFGSAEAFFYALFTAVLICVKNTVLFFICKKKNFSMSTYCIYFFAVSFVLDIVINTLNTVLEIMTGGLPEITEHYVILAQPYLESVFENIIGLFVMIWFVKFLDKKYKKIKEETTSA